MQVFWKKNFCHLCALLQRRYFIYYIIYFIMLFSLCVDAFNHISVGVFQVL